MKGLVITGPVLAKIITTAYFSLEGASAFYLFSSILITTLSCAYCFTHSTDVKTQTYRG